MTPTIAFLTIALITLPQWCLMLLKPNHKWTQKLVDSDIIPFVLLLIYVSCMAQLHHFELNFSSFENLLQLLIMEDFALGAWALIGFFSLVIGGWIFNRIKTLELPIAWIVSSFLILLMACPFVIWLVHF